MILGGGCGYDYKGVAQWIFVMMEQSYILIVVVFKQTYTYDKISQNYIHTHTYTQVHEKLVKSE